MSTEEKGTEDAGNTGKMEGENNAAEELKAPIPRTTSPQKASFPSHSWSLEMLLRRLKAIDEKQDDKLATILDSVGEFGTFQRRLVASTFIPHALLSYYMYADQFVFTAQRPYCNTSWILDVAPNLSEAEQLNLTLPRAPNGSFLTCLMYIPVPWDLQSIIKFGLNYTDTCQNGWIYPDSKKRSLINEFDLVCGNEPSKENVETIFMAGILTGSLIFGFISDKLGRYPAILMETIGLIVFGFGTAFVTSFQQYLFFRFIVSQSIVGYAITSLTLVVEWLVGEHRVHAMILAHCFLSVGTMSVTACAYAITHWRILFLLSGTPIILLIWGVWVLQESPRWLIMKGKLEEAKQVLHHAAMVNEKSVDSNLLNELQLQGKNKSGPASSVLDFYSNRHLFKVVLVMASVWFTVSYSYMTLILKMKDFDVSIYFGKVIPNILQVPTRLCSLFLLEHLGRKWTLSLALIQATIMCSLLLLLPTELKSTMVLVIMFGEFSLAAAVTIFFIYTAELLPTVLRTTGLGMVALAWAAGAISSLTIFSQVPSQVPMFLCCISTIIALCFSSLVPDTKNRPIYDSVEYSSRTSFFRESINSYQKKSEDITSDILEEDFVSHDESNKVVANPIVNAMPVTSNSSAFSSTLRRSSLKNKPSPVF